MGFNFVLDANKSGEDPIREECLQRRRKNATGGLTFCGIAFLRIPWTLDEHGERSRRAEQEEQSSLGSLQASEGGNEPPNDSELYAHLYDATVFSASIPQLKRGPTPLLGQGGYGLPTERLRVSHEVQPTNSISSWSSQF